MDATGDFVLRSRDARGVITLTLNRRQSFNALSEEMLAALASAFEAVAADDSARCVVLAGAGKAFCAGHDLKQMRAKPSLGYYEDLFGLCGEMMLAIQRLPLPVIARTASRPRPDASWSPFATSRWRRARRSSP